MITQEKIAELANKAIKEPVYPDERFPPSMYYRFLKLLTAEIKFCHSVELGVSGGGGLLHMAIGNPDGNAVGIDIAYDHPERLDYIQETYSNASFLLGDSIEAAELFSDKTVDVLFIDTDHTLKRTVDEFTAWRPKMAVNGVICFDDLFRPGMEDAIKQVEDMEGKKVHRFDFLHDGSYPHGGGYGIMVL